MNWAPARVFQSVWILFNSVVERNLAGREGFARLHQRTLPLDTRLRIQVLSARAAVRRVSRHVH